MIQINQQTKEPIKKEKKQNNVNGSSSELAVEFD